ncbi:unnamed protein product [Cylindrotheca closterium]|uniref:Potassium channel domain-containing protein n=1 Tax=Cylindrotheca closterium TaxID=2856 RepID=A0AAD2G9W7_9STRA|nr:unnamed protein product [Cylindrotheca closterium]
MESQEDGGPEPIVWKRISSAVESDSGRLEASESLPNETETSTDGESDPKRLKTDESSIPKESTTNGEAVPVSEAAKRQNMIETELNGMIKEMMDSEDFQEEDEMEPESYEAIMKAAKEICYTRKIYDVSADKIVFFPSITKTIVNMDLFEKAEEYYYDEGDEFPMEYSMGLRNIAFEKLEAEGEDDDDEEMDDDMMERLSMAVQLTEDDKDELQEAIAAAEAADKDEADQDGAMDPVTEAADEEEAEGEMGSKEDSAMNTVTEITDQEKEDRYTDEKDDSVMDLVNEVTDQDEANQDTGEKEDATNDPIIEISHRNEQDMGQSEDSGMDPVNEVTDQEDVDQETDEKEVSAADPIGPQVESFSASPTETTTSATVSTGEAVPVSEATKRQNMIETELNGMIKEMMDSEDFQEEDEMEPESYEAIMKAAKEICYTRKIYDVSADKIVFFPSITKTIVNMDLFEKAEEYYYDEGDEFPMEYSMGLRNVAFEKLEAEGEDDDDEEMDDDMMERLSMAVQLTEDDKDELQEAIAAAEAADKEEADQDGAMDPVTEAADEEEAEGEMGSKEDSAMNTVTEITDQEKEDRYTDEKDDSVMDLVNEVTDQDEANQDTGEKEDATNDPIIEISHRNEQDMGQSEDSGMDPVNEVTDQEDVDQETDEKEVSAADPIGPQVESFSASPTETTTSATVSTGEAVPVSEATKRQNMIETELNGMIKEMMDSEDFQEEDEMEPESYEAIMKAAKEICYTRKIYDVSADKIVFFPSITKTIVNMDLFEKAEEYYYDEGDEFPMEYSMGLRNVAFEKLEAEGEDDDDEEMDDDMMERLSMAVQLTEDDKDELQEAIAAAEAADKEEADQDGAMDPVTEAADEEEAEGEMGSTEDSAMNTVTEITDQEKEDRYTDEKDDSVMDLVNEVTDQDEADQSTDENELSAIDAISPKEETDKDIDEDKEDSAIDTVNEVSDPKEADNDVEEDKEDSAIDTVTKPADQDVVQDIDKKEDCAMDTVTEVIDQEETDKDIDNKADSAIDPIIGAAYSEEADQDIDNKELSVIDPTSPQLEASSKALANSDLVEAKLTDEGSEAKIDKLDRPPDRSIVPESVPEQDYLVSKATTKKILSTHRVISSGAGLILFGMTGFYTIPGMIADGAEGSKLVNSFYCSVMSLTTVGFGDICPGETDVVGRIFLTMLPLFGLGFFCGPIMELASSWQNMVPGGALSVGTLMLVMGVSMLTTIEGLSYSEAVHLCVITGTTIGYGDLTPRTNAGRFFLALYAIANCNVMGGFLGQVRELLESLCAVKDPDVPSGASKRKTSRPTTSPEEIAAFDKEKVS